MKISQLALFLTIVLTLYTLLNAYLFYHGWVVLAPGSLARRIFVSLFLLLVVSYPLGRILERLWSARVVNLFTILGSFWIGIMVYLVMLFLVADGLQIIVRLLPWLPHTISHAARLGLTASILGIALLIVLGGYLNAQRPRIVRLDLNINKKVPGLKELHIVMASDIHLGTLVGARQLQKFVRMANTLQPDLVLLAGDLLDEDMHPERCNSICACLTQLKPRLGVYSVPGNHEYYVGLQRAREYLQQFQVTMLTDERRELAGKIYLVGRHDAEKGRFLGEQRLPLAQLLQDSDPALTIIVLDHQPVNLKESMDNGVDLQLSGHTHHGQLWPFNYLTRRVYLISHGYKQLGQTHFYVSSGFGTWGPPIRTNSRPELVDIHLNFLE